MVFIIFFVVSFLTQIETLYFGAVFPILTQLDILWITLAGLFPLPATVPLAIIFFKNKDQVAVAERKEIPVKSILIKLGMIGVLYVCVYMTFGYFVAWQFEELRVFYSGSPEKLSFGGQLLNNLKINPAIYPFQLLRGILFGACVLPLLDMLRTKAVFITSVCLVYLCTAVVLLIPNVLFPDMVRYGHLLEMTSSMLLFGIIAGSILWKKS
jgi:hypothetical protein